MSKLEFIFVSLYMEMTCLNMSLFDHFLSFFLEMQMLTLRKDENGGVRCGRSEVGFHVQLPVRATWQCLSEFFDRCIS